MKALQIALIAAFLLPLGGNAMAEANAAKYSGTSSYKSGFSSQKNNSSKNNSPKAAPGKNNSSFGSFGSRQRDPAQGQAQAPAPAAPAAAGGAAPSAKRGGFGAFGSAGSGSAPAANQSAMGKDLAQSQSQAQALKTLDERRAAANAPAPLPPVDNRVPGVGQSAPPPNYGPQSYGQQPYNPPPVVLQQGGGNGMGAAILGFMLGRATATHASPSQGYYPANAVPGNPGAVAQQQRQQPSFGATVLRIFAWLLVLSVIGWLVYFALRFFKRGTARSRANYSFERE